MCMCEKCSKMFGAILLVLGVLFLLQNLNVWSFWNIQWYTVLFLLAGFGMIGCYNCKEYRSDKPPKKK